jgi:hypothetical protein
VLRPDNSYRLQVSLAFHWQPDGPAQRYLRQSAATRDGYTLLVGFRCWEFQAFTALRRPAMAAPLPLRRHQIGPRNR